MAALYILLVAAAAFFSTITLVVIGQEISPILSIVLFIGLVALGVWLFKTRVTRI